MISIIDYGRGNLFSLEQALSEIGAESQRVETREQVCQAKKLILPGVGAFRDAMQGLTDRGLVGPIQQAVENKVPLMGICVGMQLLFTKGEEFGETDGLGLIPGIVKRLPDFNDKTADRIPNVGWREVQLGPRAASLGIKPEANKFYFVHSFAPMVGVADDIAAYIPFNGSDVTVAVVRGSVSGVQFHPEKSGQTGLSFLRNFVEKM